MARPIVQTLRAFGALRLAVAVGAVVILLALPALEPDALAEPASEPTAAAAGLLDVGSDHSCAMVAGAGLRCWGFGGDGRLGYGNLETIGDRQTPGSVGPVDLGGRAAVALSAGGFHTCAVLDDTTVRCWGSNAVGQLGYGNTRNIGDDEAAGSGGPVDLGPSRTAKAIAAGGGHTCAILDDRSVRCWGYDRNGQLGQGPVSSLVLGDNETPGSVDPVDLGRDGAGRALTAVAISAGRRHTCAILDDHSVRCWGYGAYGQLGYGDKRDVGFTETPGSVSPVDLGRDGTGRALTAVAIGAGADHTCAILDDHSVRCWGYAGTGQLGYANFSSIGDNESPGSAGPVDLGPGRTARAITAGSAHTCAILDDHSVRCWGDSSHGQLGYGNVVTIGDDETPGSVGPVDLGPGRTAIAISAGQYHTCARLDDGSVRCWGYAATGQLGLCDVKDIGDDETPGSARPVDLNPPADGDSGCSPRRAGSRPVPTAPETGATGPAPFGTVATLPGDDPPGLRAEAARRRAFRTCLSQAAVHARRQRSRFRRRCITRWGRMPGTVTGLRASVLSGGSVLLSFTAPGSDGSRPPAARGYLVKQSHRPITSGRAFRSAQTLCKGTCRFAGAATVGGELTVTVTDLRPATTYYYAVAARDNVSGRLGARSPAVRVTAG